MLTELDMHLAQGITRLAKMHQGTLHRGKYWGFVANLPEIVMPALEVARQHLFLEHPTFLDVGCGVGNIMLIAEAFGFQSYGIEHNKALAKYNPYYREPWCSSPKRVYLQDAFSFRFYRKFDVVYLFQPIRNYALEEQLEEHIEDRLKANAVYICSHKVGERIRTDKQFKQLSTPNTPASVWVKIREEEAVKCV